jgi:uncharacterized SAM-binding protein YcdF (DUF218 family)
LRGPGSFSIPHLTLPIVIHKRFRLIVLSAAAAVLLLLAWWLFVSLGHLLHHEDPLMHADTIFVLAGSRADRVVEAGDLYHEGWAPRILLSRQLSDKAEVVLRDRGIPIPSEVDFQRDILVQMGVPRSSIDDLGSEQITTATETDRLFELASANRWTRIVVVTSKFHTARTRLAMSRRFSGTPTEIIVRATRYDTANLDRWWASRADLRFAIVEIQKLVAYWVGLGG